RRADAALQALPEDQQAYARRIILRLVQLGEGRADTRRQQPVAELRSVDEDPSLFNDTLKHLTDSRLLTMSGAADDADTTVDIAHEALISGWPTLQEWLTERREAELVRRRLQSKAAEWVRLGRGTDGLLSIGATREAEHWLDSPGAADVGYDENQ